MPHMFINRPRLHDLTKGRQDLRSQFRWETINAVLYKIGGLMFIVGSIFFFPRYEAYADLGAWVFFAGPEVLPHVPYPHEAIRDESHAAALVASLQPGKGFWGSTFFQANYQQELFDHPALAARDEVEALIDWGRIETLLPRGEEKRQTGRSGYPAQTLFRALLLGLWYELSDVKLSAQLARDLLFRKFLPAGAACGRSGGLCAGAVSKRARAEPIFGHWKRHWGLRRTRFLGLAKMHIVTALAAVGWNLWKGARFRRLYG